MAPANENECRQMLYTGMQLEQPAVVRYPRGSGNGCLVEKEMRAIPIGKGVIEMHGKHVAILAFGNILGTAEIVGRTFGATVVNMRFVKPLDEQLILDLAKDHELLVTIEENAVKGGAGSGVNEFLCSQSISTSILNIGIPDLFIEQGTRDECLRASGLDAESIIRLIQQHPVMNTCHPTHSTLVY